MEFLMTQSACCTTNFTKPCGMSTNRMVREIRCAVGTLREIIAIEEFRFFFVKFVLK